jgi:hypothetical protein
MAIYAVLTGDIVNSTTLNKANEKKLHKELPALFAGHNFEFYRGDSFQALVKEPAAALRLALLCRTIAISLPQVRENVSSDIRIGIGIGKVESPVKTLNVAKGEAFILSGRALEELSKTEKRMAIATTTPLANQGLQVIADYIDNIFEQMTAKQAEVIFQLLKGETQQAVAYKLKKNKSTIHQRVTSGRWPEILRILQQYENIINLLT